MECKEEDEPGPTPPGPTPPGEADYIKYNMTLDGSTIYNVFEDNPIVSLDEDYVIAATSLSDGDSYPFEYAGLSKFVETSVLSTVLSMFSVTEESFKTALVEEFHKTEAEADEIITHYSNIPVKNMQTTLDEYYLSCVDGVSFDKMHLDSVLISMSNMSDDFIGDYVSLITQSSEGCYVEGPVKDKFTLEITDVTFNYADAVDTDVGKNYSVIVYDAETNEPMFDNAITCKCVKMSDVEESEEIDPRITLIYGQNGEDAIEIYNHCRVNVNPDLNFEYSENECVVLVIGEGYLNKTFTYVFIELPELIPPQPVEPVEFDAEVNISNFSIIDSGDNSQDLIYSPNSKLGLDFSNNHNVYIVTKDNKQYKLAGPITQENQPITGATQYVYPSDGDLPGAIDDIFGSAILINNATYANNSFISSNDCSIEIRLNGNDADEFISLVDSIGIVEEV